MDNVIQLSNNRGQNVLFKSFDSFIYVSGTLEVTVHELMENGAIGELYKALDDYARHNLVDWLCLMNDFEVKKGGKRICEGERHESGCLVVS